VTNTWDTISMLFVLQDNLIDRAVVCSSSDCSIKQRM